MYVKPTIYTCQRVVTSDAVKASDGDVLGWCYNAALEETVAAANNRGDMLDPNSLTVKITVEARAL